MTSYARAARAALPAGAGAHCHQKQLPSSAWRLPKFKTGSRISLDAIPAFIWHVLFVLWDFFFIAPKKIELQALSTLQSHSDSTTMQVTYPSPY